MFDGEGYVGGGYETSRVATSGGEVLANAVLGPAVVAEGEPTIGQLVPEAVGSRSLGLGYRYVRLGWQLCWLRRLRLVQAPQRPHGLAGLLAPLGLLVVQQVVEFLDRTRPWLDHGQHR
jgi:hypothetical protein